MSTVRTARRLLSSQGILSSASVPATPVIASLSSSHCHSFHSSAACLTRRKPRFRNVKARDMGLTTPERIDAYADEKFPEYTAEEKKILAGIYTPQQMEAVEAAEAAIDRRDLTLQGRLRDDVDRQNYLEDFSVVKPVIDWRVKTNKTVPTTHITLPPTPSEWMDEYVEKLGKFVGDTLDDRVHRAYARALRKVRESNPAVDLTDEELDDLENDPEARKKFLIEKGEDGAGVEGQKEAKPAPGDAAKQEEMQRLFLEIENKFVDELNAMEQRRELEPSRLEFWNFLEPNPGGTVLSPDLGKVPGVAGLHKTARDPEDELADDAGEFTHAGKVTGMKVRDMQGMLTKVLVVRFVTNQTRLGKIRSVSVVTVAGNGDGWLGVGVAKSTEQRVAELTSKLLAIRNMKPVRRYENRTIYGNVAGKVSGTVVELRSRPPGFGLRVSHRIFEMCRMAGIHDLSARIPRSRNPFNTVHACYQALMNQPDPEEIAIGRGKKLVDVRKVYYGGAVY